MAARRIAGGDVSKTWNETKAAVLEQLRAAYLAEVTRFAETLRPRFESGDLRGYTDEDSEHENERDDYKAPLFHLEDLCDEAFRLDVDRFGEEAYRNAYLIRSVSPGDAHTEDAQPIAGQAGIAVAFDVLAVAQARGWYIPAEGEDPTIPAAEARWALEATP